MESLVELVGDQSPSPEAPSRCKRAESKRRWQKRSDGEEWGVGAIEGKEIRGYDLIKYFLHTGVRITLSPRSDCNSSLPERRDIWRRDKQTEKGVNSAIRLSKKSK